MAIACVGIALVTRPDRRDGSETLSLAQNAQEAYQSQFRGKLESALDEVTHVQFENTPLVDVVDALARTHDIKMVIDEQALKEDFLTIKEPVNLVLSGPRLRSVLRLILEPLSCSVGASGDARPQALV